MKYLLTILFCLCFAVSSAVAEPTMEETVAFIKAKIEKHGVVKYRESICDDIVNLSCERDFLSFYLDMKTGIIYFTQLYDCSLNDDHYTIGGHSSRNLELPINRMYIKYEQFGYSARYGYKYKHRLFLEDKQKSKTITSVYDFNYNIKELTDYGRRQCDRDDRSNFSIAPEKKVDSFYILFDEQIQAKKVEAALKHLVKLAKVKWPEKKELF